MIEILKKAAAHQTQISGSSGPATLEWNPQELGTSVVRALYNPVGDNSSVTEATGNITAVSDLSGNSFDLSGTNNPNWNSATSTIECDHTANEYLIGTIDTAPSTSVGHLFIYAELGTADIFGRYVGSATENDTNQADYGSPLILNAGGDLVFLQNSATIISATPPTGFNLIEVRAEAGNTSYWVNGVQLATAATGSALNFEQIQFGRGWTNSYGASINWRCACLVEGTLSEDDRERIEGWMMQQCSDQASLPNGHTYKNTTFSDPGSSFSPATSLDGVLWHWEAPGSRSWTTLTGGADNGDGLTEYLDSVPNLISANQGSSLGNEVYVDNAATDYLSGKGYALDDTNKGIKHWNPSGGEVAIKLRMFDGSSETGLRHAKGSFTEVHCWYITSGYGTNDNFRKDNNNVESKLEGGSQWKHTDRYNSQNDGLGTDLNDGVSPTFLTTMSDGATYMVARVRDMNDTYSSINTDVPGVHPDGNKYVQFIGPVANGNTWGANVAINDTLNESIVDTGYAISPAYVHDTNAREDHGSNPKEFRYNELSIVKFIWYTPRVATLTELQNIYDWLNTNFG